MKNAIGKIILLFLVVLGCSKKETKIDIIPSKTIETVIPEKTITKETIMEERKDEATQPVVPDNLLFGFDDYVLSYSNRENLKKI